MLKFDRDIAHLDADSIKQKLRMAQLEIQKLKVRYVNVKSYKLLAVCSNLLHIAFPCGTRFRFFLAAFCF